MKLENQVCSLLQAKLLEYLGVNAKSANYHAYPSMNSGWEVLPDGCFNKNDDAVEYYPAYNVAELGEILSVFRYDSWGFPIFMCYAHCNDHSADILGRWSCSFRNPKNFTDPNITGVTQADAMAKMLIWLIESGYITPTEVNERLQNS